MQGVSICQVDTTHFSIQCSYLNGSDISGCVYVLVSREEGVNNVAGFIERDSNEVTLEVANIGCYSEVLAYDSTTIDDILPVRTRINTSSVCPITTGNYVHYIYISLVGYTFCLFRSSNNNYFHITFIRIYLHQHSTDISGGGGGGGGSGSCCDDVHSVIHALPE